VNCRNFNENVLCACTGCLHKRQLESVLAYHDGTYNVYRARDKKNSISLDNALKGLRESLKNISETSESLART